MPKRTQQKASNRPTSGTKKSKTDKEKAIRVAVAAAYVAIRLALRNNVLTTVQMGKIAEELVWKVATVLSDGDLLFHLPKADIEGTDAIVKRKFRAAVIMVQIKARQSQRSTGAFELSLDVETLPASDPKFVLVTHFDTARPEGDVVMWWIPGNQFKHLASRSSGQYQALLSPSPKARDRWVKFRYALPEIAGLMLVAIKEKERNRR